MLSISVICVGKLKEKHYISAFSEYDKRLKPYCKFSLTELPESKLSQNPSDSEILRGLSKEAENIRKHIPSGAFIVAMCIEGTELSSTELAERIQKCTVDGYSKICFIIGSSYGINKEIKSSSDMLLSMSRMTFPHHLARVMLAEQIYRAIMINEGTKYHK